MMTHGSQPEARRFSLIHATYTDQRSTKVAAPPVQFGNMIYSADGTQYSNFATFFIVDSNSKVGQQ
jgi:hypothetical protein